MVDQAVSDVEAHAPHEPTAEPPLERPKPFAYLALFLLTLANFFNYVDRQVVAIVGQRVKVDLQMTDAQLGFLLGTAFAVFYGVVGIGMGRIADAVRRTRMMAFGLAVWSGMTAAAGLAVNFAGLAAARLGVGIGEATANPCSHSLLSDYFPARNRSAVMAVYLVGVHLGGAASLAFGGLLLQHWPTLCQALPGGACRIADWRAVFLIVGLPGIVLALLLAGLPEPRPIKKAGKGGVAWIVAREMSAAVPPFTLLNLRQIGGSPAVIRNLVFAAILVVCAAAVSRLVGDWPQWAAVALGIYSVTTWGGVLKRRDAPLYRLTFGCPTFMLAAAGGALTACTSGAVSAWGPSYVIRTFDVAPGKVGLYLGLTAAVTAGLATLVGGVIVDRWKRHDPRAPAWMTLISLLGPIPALVIMLTVHGLGGFVAAYAAFCLLAMGWSGGISAMAQDLVLPRMRATAAGAFALIMILVGSGIGPYWVGKISTLTGSLQTGLLSVLVLAPVAATCLLLAAMRLANETAEARRARARAAGEPI